MEKHNLVNEFPRHKEKIRDLKVADGHFKMLCDEYHKVDYEIRKYECGKEVTTDDHLNELRMERVHLKDEVYSYLKK